MLTLSRRRRWADARPSAKMGGSGPGHSSACTDTDAHRFHERWQGDSNRRAAARGRRVTVLLLGVIVLSLADLMVTLAFLRANWMMEANPIAEYIIRTTQSPLALVVFKFLTVGVCAALLYRARHFRSGEVAAWSAVAVLTVMCIMWRSYAAGLDDVEIVLASANANYDDGRLGLP